MQQAFLSLKTHIPPAHNNLEEKTEARDIIASAQYARYLAQLKDKYCQDVTLPDACADSIVQQFLAQY